MTQPALSVQVQELEALLGIPLVERRRGQTELTRAGEEVARRAADILRSVQDLRDYAIAVGGPLQGPMALGIIPTVAPYLLAHMLPAVRHAFPKLELTISEARTEKLLEEISMGNLDAILVSVPLKQSWLEQVPLFDDGFVLATCHGSELSERNGIGPEDLSRVDLLLLDEGHCLRDQALSFCRIVPKHVREKYGAASLGTIMQLIANGQGATFLPEIALPVETANNGQIVLREFRDAQPKRTIGLAWRETSPRTDDFRILGGMIGKIGREIARRGRDIVLRRAAAVDGASKPDRS